MPVYHRTQRLQIFGEKPEIQKLYGSRYRMVVRCVAKNDTKAWYDDNKAQIFADFGSLYSAQMSVDGIDARTGEAYDDMVLVKNEASYTRSGEYVIIFTYETLTDSFVQETEDKVDFDLNGLKRLTRTIIAKDTVAYSSVVGTSTTGTSPVLTLAQISEDQLEASEDGFKRIQEVWLESGTLSETIDNVGSQKAKVIETIGADPATPTGYSLASKQESDFEGFQTNRFTFLKDNVILSESEDEVGSQNSIVQEVFNGTPATPSGYSLANKQESDVDGIPTKRYTFLKDNVILSESKDKVGSQSAIVQEVFNGTPATPSGYSIASEQKSDVDGIPTERFTFLENDVQLSQSEDKVGSQLAISQQWFNPDADKTLAGYSLASKNTSDFEGIKTVEFRFLKDDVLLSQSEDEIGSQNAITEQWFKPEASRKTKAGYSVARNEVSDVDGIPTELYTFLKDNVELSRSEDLVGSQKAIVTEIFNPTSDPTEAGYSVARTEVSDVEGIPTKRYTFLKNDVKLSASEDEIGSQNAITEEWFKPEADREIKASYSLARKEESDVDGIPTNRFTFLKDNVELSRSEDKVGSQLAITTEVFNPTEEPTEELYSLARKEESDVEGIPTERYTFLKDNVKLSESEDRVGSQLAKVEEWFNPDEEPTINDYVIANVQKSDVEGIPTERYTFLKDNVKLSESEDRVGSQLAKVEEWFNPTEEPTIEDYVVASIQKSDIGGIPTKRYTFLKENAILSVSQDRVGSQLAVTNEVFNPDQDEFSGVDVAGNELTDYSEANRQKSDFQGIATIRYTFLKDNVVLSVSQDNVGSQLAVTNEVFNPDQDEITGVDVNGDALSDYSEASRQKSDFNGISTIRYTFLKDDVELSRSEDKVGSQLAIITEVFNPETDPIEELYSLARSEVSDVDGIPTKRFTFLKDDVELSRNEDKVGSQLAITTEVFNPTSDPAEAGYSVARAEVSDVDGIPTKRFTFLKDNVELSRSEDKVGSQLAITTQVFNPTVDPTETDYSLARTEVSDVDGIPTKQYTFLKPSILSLQQDFNNGLKRVSVQAFGMTATSVSAELAAITSSHELISQTESDYEGIKTSTFQYQLDESFTEEYELNGLKSLSITELSSTNFTARNIGVVGVAATPQAGLYLGEQDIDNGGAIKVRESVWFEAGTLNVQRVSESDGVYRVTTTFLGVEGTVVGPIIARTEGDFEGLKTITVVSMQDASGASLITGTQPVASHSILNEFTYPGVVTISKETLGGTDGTYTFKAKDFSLMPPVSSRVPATIKVSFKTSSAIAYTASRGLWNPDTWAEGFSKGIGWNYLPFSIARGFRGYRIDSSAGTVNQYTGYGIPGTNNVFDMISGSRIFGNTTYNIKVSGGPPNPEGGTYTLDYSVSLAFEDTSGVPYYKHTEIVATIPSR